MTAIGVVCLIVVFIFYWGLGWSGLASAFAGAILGTVVVAVFQAIIGSLVGTNADDGNPTTTQPKQ
jgi:hypothetical protein